MPAQCSKSDLVGKLFSWHPIDRGHYCDVRRQGRGEYPPLDDPLVRTTAMLLSTFPRAVLYAYVFPASTEQDGCCSLADGRGVGGGGGEGTADTLGSGEKKKEKSVG